MTRLLFIIVKSEFSFSFFFLKIMRNNYFKKKMYEAHDSASMSCFRSLLVNLNIFSSQELGGELHEDHSDKSLRNHFMSKDGWARGEKILMEVTE